jgi:dTDP-4-amino-4,6-dideoxygalactose transaminase
MNVPLLDLKAQYASIRKEVRAAVDGVLENQRFILGPQVTALEKEIARYCGSPHAIACASGTDALLLSLKALGVGPGDAVVTVPFTFFASAGAIVNVGARPLLVDIEKATFNLDPESLAQFLTRACSCDASGRLVHTGSGAVLKAIMPVHLYGQCADMDPILQLARRHNLAVIEDACQSIGAMYGGRSAGTMGDLGCFSFFPSKNLGGAGDGGMVITASDDLEARVRLLRTHGAKPKYHHSVVGINSRLDEIQAAILRVKLEHLEGWSELRRRNAALYEAKFIAAGLAELIKPPATVPGRTHIFHQYVIRCPQRNELQEFLKSKGVGTEIYYPIALHEQECFLYLGYKPDALPQARTASQEVLALPVYPELTKEQISYVVNAIREFY